MGLRHGFIRLMSVLILGSLLATAPAQESPESLRRRAEALVRRGVEQAKYNPWLADSPLKEAVRIYHRLNARREKADTLRKLVQVLGAYHVSLESIQEMFDIDRSSGASPKVLAEDMRNLGLAFFNGRPLRQGGKSKRDYERAFHYLNEALKLAKASGDKRLLARCHASLAAVLNFRGEVSKAISELKAALPRPCGGRGKA